MKIIKLFSDLVENPFAAKHYKSLAEYYLSINDTSNSELFHYVLTEKFNANNSNSDQKQQGHD